MLVPGQTLTADDLNNLSRLVLKTADEDVTSSIVEQNDNHLLASVAANSTYGFILAAGIGGAAAGDFRWRFTYPALAELSFGGHSIHNSVTVSAGSEENAWYATDNASPSVTTNVGTVALGTPVLLTVFGHLVTGANAGTLQLQWAQFVSNATATRIYKGSWLWVVKG